MNKRSKIYVLVLIWAAILLQLFINSAINRESKMVEQAMGEVGQNIMEGSVKAYSYYSEDELSSSARETIAKRIAKEIGLVTGYEITNKEEGSNDVTTLTKIGQFADTTVKVISLEETDEFGQQITENYILTELTLKGTNASAIDDYKKILTDLYESYGMEVNTNVYIKSQVKGSLTEAEIKEQTEEFLENMDAKEIETVKIDDVTCVYGYCRNVDEYVYQNNKKVNVNIAFSYDKNEDITYIHRAVPFVDKSF